MQALALFMYHPSIALPNDLYLPANKKSLGQETLLQSPGTILGMAVLEALKVTARERNNNCASSFRGVIFRGVFTGL
jgi:hypothetical protein